MKGTTLRALGLNIGDVDARVLLDEGFDCAGYGLTKAGTRKLALLRTFIEEYREDLSKEPGKCIRNSTDAISSGWSVGAEYVYNDKFSLRGGYHHESKMQGNRKYFNVGAGFRMNVMAIDAAYTIATSPSNPLDQTLRVSLAFDFDGIKDFFSRRRR